MQEMADHINMATYDFDAVKRQIEKDLAVMSRDVPQQADEAFQPCKPILLAGLSSGYASPTCCDD